MGLASMFLGEQNPFAQWVGQHNNMLGTIGSGLMQGQNLQHGLQIAGGALPQANQLDLQQAEKAKADALKTSQANYTLKLFKDKGFTDLVDLATAGAPMSELMQEYFKRIQPAAPDAPIKVGPGDVLLNPNTFQPLYQVPDKGPDAPSGYQWAGGKLQPIPGGPADKPADQPDIFAREKDLYGQYTSQEPVKTYRDVKNGFERVRTSAALNSGQGDVGIVYGYMKMLDPGSVVREGEFATAEQTSGVAQQFIGLYNKLLRGERLTDEQRAGFVRAAEALYNDTAGNLTDLNQQFTDRASGWGVDPNRIIVSPENFPSMGPPQIKNDDDYAKLKSGDVFIDPNGILRKKP